MMKHQGSSYYCRWFTLLLVAMGIVLASPDIHTNFVGNNNNNQTAKAKESVTTITKSAMQTIRTLETMSFIDANRYYANKNNNNNNHNNNNSHNNGNSNSNNIVSTRSKKNNTTNIEVPIKQRWSKQFEQLEHIVHLKHLKQLKRMQEHMVSTPQSMTIIVEKPTIAEETTTKSEKTTTAKETIAATMSTTAITTMPTKAIKRTHSNDCEIKMPPNNGANINVNGIKEYTMISKKKTFHKRHELEKKQQQKRKQHLTPSALKWSHWQQEYRRQQKSHSPTTTASRTLASSKKKQKSQLYVANTLLGGEISTQTSINTDVMRLMGRVAVKGAAKNVELQTKMAISSKKNNNNNTKYASNRENDTTTTTAVPNAQTTTITATQKPQSQSLKHISYYNIDANDNITSKLATTEMNVKMVGETVKGGEHMAMETEDNKDESLLRWLSQQQLALVSTQHNRWIRQVDEEEEPIDKCRKFIEGEGEKNEFYSPDYPNDYPKNINCTRKIIAPKGQIIRLDFRNSFHIEAKEDCKFDFLEIRDGQYGFSPLIGKFCGTDFPPEITSKERYLWLHFHSDESIEYSGFTAVYEFIDRSKEAPTTDLNCTIEKDGFEGFVNSTDVPYDIRETVIKTKIALDCIWRIQVQDNWKIQVKFLDFKLSKPNDCDTNFLDIFPEKTVMPLRLKNFCGSAGEGITSESNILNLRFFAEPAAINSTFSILYTAFRDRGAACIEGEYDCEDATCISDELKCNHRDNCKFRWDEEGCDKQSAEQSEHMIIIMIVFGLILGGMIITFLVNCIRKIMHDQKIIREHIRQSKESKLDELGRNSKARSRDNLSNTMTRPKHSQTSLHNLDDTSNRYYREVVPMSHTNSKTDVKEHEHSILRHRNDMIVQTSFCSGGDDNSSVATLEATATNACDMGCQTRESLFATPSLMHQNSMGSLRDKTSLHSRSRFSTFGYEAPQPTPPPLPIGGVGGRQLTALNIRDAQGYIEMRERHPAPMKSSMPHMQRMNALPPTPPTASSVAQPELCHHHHQHAAHTHVHAQQQQQHTHPHLHSHSQQQQQSTAAQQQLSMQKQSKDNMATGRSTAATTITTTTSAAPPPPTTLTQGKGKQKLSQSTAYIDIRNSAPDVIIMTSH